MSEMKQRFDAVSDRLKEMEKRTIDPTKLTKEQKAVMVEELFGMCHTIGDIISEKMKRGDRL